MRILLFGPYPSQDGQVTGGVMAVVAALAQALARNEEDEVAVASAAAGAKDRLEQEGRIKIYRLGIPRLPRARGHRRIRRKLIAVAQDFRPHIIHAHGTGYYAAAALDGSWPVILTAHGVVYEEAKRSGSLGLKDRLAWQYDARLEQKVLQRARHVIAISPYIRQAFSAYRHLHWFDIPNPVDDIFWSVAAQPPRETLFTPARVIPRKGIDLLIQAFITIADDFPQAMLRIAGEMTTAPAFAGRCQQMAAAAGITERVHFLGNLDKTRLVQEYERAAGVVLPARQETAPVAIEEALAAGRPVIATRVGGIPWMIEHEKNGLLIPPENVPALATAMARLLAGGDEVVAWAQNARTSAAPYRLHMVAEATRTAYRTLLQTA